MKALNSADPKVIGIVVALVVVLAGYMVFKSTQNPNSKAAPPIVTGGGGSAGTETNLKLPSGATGGAPPLSTGMPGAGPGMTMPGGANR